MNLTNGVKQLLRMCGHAFVSTVHDRLNGVDQQLSQIASQLGDLRAAADNLAGADRALLQVGIRTIEEMVDRQSSRIASELGDLRAAADSLAEADGALLQGGIRTIEELKDVRAEFRRRDAEAKQRLDEVEARWCELLGAVQQSLREQDGRLIETVEDRLARSQQTVVDAVAQLQGAVQQSLREQDGRLIETVEDRLARSQQTVVDAVVQLQGAVQQSLREQNGHLTETFEDRLARSHQTMVDAVAQLQGALQQSLREHNGHLTETFEDRLARSHQTMVDAVAQFQGAVQRSLLDQDGHLIETVEDRLVRAHQTMVDAVAQLQGDFSQFQNHLGWVLDNEVPRQVCVETGEYGFTNPEVGLLSFLHSYLPGSRAIDIGANVGNVSEPLLNAGYEVYAFEPVPEVYKKLVRRMGKRKGFHAFPCALGSHEAEMPLHMATDLSADKTYGDASQYSSLTQHSMPADLPFTSARPVKVMTLEGLHSAGTLPQDIGLVKIDTEGYDLEVVRGMGERRYPVVATEFWDSEIPFGGSHQLYTLNSLVGEMRRRDYLWHIVLYRIWGQNQSGFYCSHDQSIPKSWGNVVFFRDYPIFAQAQSWCSAVLPRTFFKAVAQA